MRARARTFVVPVSAITETGRAFSANELNELKNLGSRMSTPVARLRELIKSFKLIKKNPIMVRSSPRIRKIAEETC